MVLPLVPDLLRGWVPGASRASASFHTGALAAAYMLAIVVLAPLWGRFSDRRGRRRVLLVGMAGYALASTALAWTQSMEQAYALRFVAGAFAGAVLPAVFAAAGELDDIDRRAAWLAWLGTASLLGYLVGPALSGAITQIAPGAAQWPLYAGGAVALLGFLFAYACFPRAAPGGQRERAAPGGPYGLARVAVLSVGAMFGLGAFEVGLTVFVSQRLTLGTGALALLFVECSVAMLVVQGWLALAPAAASRRSIPIVAGAFGAMAAGFAVLALTRTVTLAYVGVALIATGSGALLPLLTFLASLPRIVGLGTAIGIQTAAANLGQAAGSAAAGWLYGGLNRESFWLYAGLMAIGAGMAVRADERSRT